ncbi:GNAT family N-acyltransferase (plasmid) [Sulfitobacter sp. OXR-159]|uniref:N-acyl amino acid synthase FeeM domain-containing protein n=1 Tax=Sulfitobacter sp. OXR-159 TaxID=3100174 RepID=UPI002AC99C50|nr:GNAT family N-acyltransferase [Sulfitobacter sp. OXR-159]WPZ31638.1 GNAT family N-acyltransferase [Sulfitobacter sp. OXR-159]
MDEHIDEALKQVRYKVMTESSDLEAIYRLRYTCYRAQQSIAKNEFGRMTDPFDEAANCVHVAVLMNDEVLAALRLHLVSKLSHVSPTLEVFPEVLDRVENEETVLDPTRFVIAPKVRGRRVPLHFLALRIPFLAAMFYDIDWALAPVRGEHTAFYRRYLGYKPELEARVYPGLKKPVQLLIANFREQRDVVLARTPVFGPMSEFPNANIAFPKLSGVYASSQKGRFKVA